jgi:hypothetical protein
MTKREWTASGHPIHGKCANCIGRVASVARYALRCSCGSVDTALPLCEACLNELPEVVELPNGGWQSTFTGDVCDDCDGSHRATTGEW